ncbi:hypothetical protein [Mucilaginibacter sp. OK098]|uniref:hypothetical protein n=1 Tax=Mucilaginibacter sp. OK098 TaxID=1855297 RepID=UPI00093243B6|nr:hypothetical protein [Mucilaginibacter sp. OK098]
MIRNLSSKPFLLLIIILLQSCISTKIASNKGTDYIKQPKKIFILMNNAKETNEFCSFLLAKLKRKLLEKGVQSDSYRRNPLSLETEKDIDSKINSYAPEALMVIQQKIIHYTNGRVDGGTIEISLIDSETKKTVWKSEFEFYAMFRMTDAVDKSIKKIVNKLIEDKLIKA